MNTNQSTATVEITRGGISVGPGQKLLIIAGPCQIESKDHALRTAELLKTLESKYSFNLVYKSSFDKANRTSIKGIRGPGLDEGLRILQEVKEQIGVPVVSDIHSPEQAATAAEVLDILQIPALLCRQTDLLLAAAKTGKTINIKKGQFLHPEDMRFAAEKVASCDNGKILLCERGTCFGYRDLIVDMRGFVMLKKMGYPVVFDATHSVQHLGGTAGHSGGDNRYVLPLAKGAIAIGVDALFLECHEDPKNAPSDGAVMLKLDTIEPIISQLTKLYNFLK